MKTVFSGCCVVALHPKGVQHATNASPCRERNVACNRCNKCNKRKRCLENTGTNEPPPLVGACSDAYGGELNIESHTGAEKSGVAGGLGGRLSLKFGERARAISGTVP